MAFFLLYELASLGEQVAFTQGPYERDLLPANIIISVLLVALVAFVLTRPHIRQAFTSQHEES